VENNEYQWFVHPLTYLKLSRQCEPTYCPIANIRLVAYWKELGEQTEADYYGWGIN